MTPSSLRSTQVVTFAAVLVLLKACASLDLDRRIDTGSTPLCGPGVDLGRIAVLIDTNWREDQKQPLARTDSARRVATDVFSDLPCGRSSTDSRDVDTRAVIIVRELGPQIAVGLGFAGHTDVDFSLVVTDVPSGNEILSVSEHRRDGGLFVIRTLEDALAAFEQALNDIVRSPPPDESRD